MSAIARLVQGDEDAVRGVIHRFNETGLASLDPQWAGGRPRLISPEDEAALHPLEPAQTHRLPRQEALPGWCGSDANDYVSSCTTRGHVPGHQDLEKSNDPERDTKLARIEQVTTRFPDRVFAFDELWSLTIRPHLGVGWARKRHPERLPANYHKTHHPGQPLRAPRSDDPHRGRPPQGRAVFHLLGQPDRSALRTAAHLRRRRVLLPESHCGHPRTSRAPALAQRRVRARIRREKGIRWAASPSPKPPDQPVNLTGQSTSWRSHRTTMVDWVIVEMVSTGVKVKSQSPATGPPTN